MNLPGMIKKKKKSFNEWSVCVFLPLQKPFPVDYRLLVKGRFAKIGIPLDVFGFGFLITFCVLKFSFGSLQTSLLCILGELAGKGSVAVAVAVGVNDRCQMLHLVY